MSVPIRAALGAIPDPQVLAAANLPGAVNLAGNELFSPPPAAVVQALVDAAGAVNRYPQVASSDLAAALAKKYGTDPIGLVVGNGAANVLLQLLDTVCETGDKVVFSTPGFEAYPSLARLARAAPVQVPLGHDGEDLDALLAASKRAQARVVIITNPYNPTGSLIPNGRLEDFLDRVPERMLVVLDEAYREFVAEPDAPDGIALAARGRWENLATVRTLSKAFALGGARVGYCVASSTVAAAARKCGVPFSVNLFAQAAGLAAITSSDELASVHNLMRVQRDSVRRELVDLGFQVPESHANFLWIPLAAHAARFRDHCLNHKVHVRLFPAEGVRVTVGSPEDNNLFLAAARTFTHR